MAGTPQGAAGNEEPALRAALNGLYPGQSIGVGAARRDANSVIFDRTPFFHASPRVTHVLFQDEDGSLNRGLLVETWSQRANLLHETLIGGGDVLDVVQFPDEQLRQGRFSESSRARRGAGRRRHRQRQLRHAEGRLEAAHADVSPDRQWADPRGGRRCEHVRRCRRGVRPSARAVGAIIANNTGTAEYFAMGAGTAKRVTIPAVMVGKNDGIALKGKAGTSATERLKAEQPLQLDGSIDADIVFHEYGHGLTWRMSGVLAGAIGEGASDVNAFLLNGDDRIGEYAYSNPLGIRRFPYEGYPNTYGDVGNGDGTYEVHSDGEIYAAAMWRLKTLCRAAAR